MRVSDGAGYKLRYVCGVVLCALAAWVSLRFPDLDRLFTLPPVFVHRSLLFHSPFLALLLLCVVRGLERTRYEGPITSHIRANPVPRLMGIGISAGFAVHLCFDLFPRWWHGYALVYMPFWGRLAPLHSAIWLGLSGLICLWVACCLLRKKFDLFLAVACVAACYGYAAYREPRIAFSALVALCVASAVAFVLPRFKFGQMPDATVGIASLKGN
jgi:hypothetical protein